MELNSYTARGKYYFLKIKLTHLAAESRIIRRHENKTKDRVRHLRKVGKPTNRLEWRRDSLASHRQGVVRDEARATQLAYGLLRGKSYRSIEDSIRDPYLLSYVIAPKVARMVADYGEGEFYGHALTGDTDRRRQAATAIVEEWLQDQG